MPGFWSESGLMMDIEIDPDSDPEPDVFIKHRLRTLPQYPGSQKPQILTQHGFPQNFIERGCAGLNLG